MTWVNGEIYKGQWDNDTPHGHGEYLYINGDKYTGEFKNG